MKINPKVFGSVFGLLAFLIVNISYTYKGFYISLEYIKDVVIFTIIFYVAGAITAMIINSFYKPPKTEDSEEQNNSN